MHTALWVFLQGDWMEEEETWKLRNKNKSISNCIKIQKNEQMN